MCGITLNAICFVKCSGVGVVGDENAFRLVPQLVHRLLARAGNGLIGRDHDALDRRSVVQRLQRDNKLRRGAIRVRDDVLLLEADDGVGVHLRHNQRHIQIHTPCARIIDDDAAGLADLRRPVFRHVAARRHQREIAFRKVERRKVLAFQRFVAKRDFHAGRAARGDGENLVHREFALVEDVQHFAAHIARGADDSDVIAHDGILFLRSRGM